MRRCHATAQCWVSDEWHCWVSLLRFSTLMQLTASVVFLLQRLACAKHGSLLVYYNKWQQFFPQGTKMHSDWLDKPCKIFLTTHSNDQQINGHPLLQILCLFYLFLTLSLASAFWCLGFIEEAHGLMVHLLCTMLLSWFHPANSDLFFPSHALSFWAHISEPYGSV